MASCKHNIYLLLFFFLFTAACTSSGGGSGKQVSGLATDDGSLPINNTGSNFINNGESNSTSTTATLSLSATDNVGITGYYASESANTPSASDPGWKSLSSTTSYSASVTFILSNGNGTKTVYVWFKDAAGNISSEANDSVILGSPPSAPTGVSATVSDGQATISWDAVSGATSYNLYWSTTSGVTKFTGTKISNVTSPYTHAGITNGMTYYYVVYALNDFGESYVESTQVTVIPQVPISLPKTGQTESYAAGDDGALQIGVVWPNPRFTDNSDGTVTDNLTGLIWTKDANAPGPAGCSPAPWNRWQDALDYVTCLNNNYYLGYTDWRLPNRSELHSLSDYSRSGPALPSGHPFLYVLSESYW